MSGSQRLNDTLTRGTLEERGDDYYATPSCTTEALLREVKLPKLIWEPACGDGAISKLLEAAGHTVISTDLNNRGYGTTPVDFLMETRAPEGVKCIVTNPPYKLANEFVDKALELVPVCHMLLRLAYLEGTTRARLIDNHLRRVVMGADRPPMMHREDYEGPKLKDSRSAFGWFEFTRRPTKGVIQVRRTLWQPEKGKKKAASAKKAKAADPNQLSLSEV